jgi:transposase
MNSLVTTIVDITLNIGELQQFEGNKDGMANHLDMNYSRAMNIPFGDDKKRISNLELSQALREIFDGELSKLVEYKEKIKKVDDLIDTIDSDNIRTKIEQINGIIKVASITDTEINYTLPKTLSSILEDAKEDKAKTPAEELDNMRSLIAQFLSVADTDKAKKEALRAKLQEATTTSVVTGIPVAQATPTLPALPGETIAVGKQL